MISSEQSKFSIPWFIGFFLENLKPSPQRCCKYYPGGRGNRAGASVIPLTPRDEATDWVAQGGAGLILSLWKVPLPGRLLLKEDGLLIQRRVFSRPSSIRRLLPLQIHVRRTSGDQDGDNEELLGLDITSSLTKEYVKVFRGGGKRRCRTPVSKTFVVTPRRGAWFFHLALGCLENSADYCHITAL